MDMASTDGALAADTDSAARIDPTEVAFMLVDHVADGLDHPELWRRMPDFVATTAGLVDALFIAHATMLTARNQAHVVVLIALCRAAEGRLADARAALNTLTTQHSQSPLVQGATFYVNGLSDPDQSQIPPRRSHLHRAVHADGRARRQHAPVLRQLARHFDR